MDKKMKDYSIRESVDEGIKDIGRAAYALAAGIVVIGLNVPNHTANAVEHIVVDPAFILGARAIDKVGTGVNGVKTLIKGKKEAKEDEYAGAEVIVVDFTRTSAAVL